MTREEMIEKVLAIKSPKKEKYIIYQLGRELGLELKPTNCGRCLSDYVAIIKEELGLIENASEESSFNDYEYIYMGKRPQAWNGHIINQETDPSIITEFIKRFPNYYKAVKKEAPVVEETETVHEEPVEENNTNNED